MMQSPASAGRRLAAFAIDYLVVSAYAIVLAIVSIVATSLVTGWPRAAHASPWLFDLLAFTTLVLPVILYFALTEASRHRATLGKRRLGLIVVGAGGGRLAAGRSLLRSTVKFLPWQIAHTSLFHIPGWPTAVERIPPPAMTGLVVSQLLVVIFIIGLFRRDGRTLYDRIARTRVVCTRVTTR